MQIIAHIDMDAFFAAVEELDKPYLRGLPVVIGADPAGGSGRGVVSTANYAARKYGIHSAQPIQVAWRHSEHARANGKPAAAFLSGRMRRYTEVSHSIFERIRMHAPVVEQTSVDEGYVDMSHVGSFANAEKVAHAIKDDIARHVGLTCSIGVGPNKMVAKIASDAEKPNGLTVVPEASVSAFLAPRPVSVIPGTGPKMCQALGNMRIYTIADLQAHSWQALADMFGSRGFDLHQKAFGVYDTPLATHAASPKSIGEEETFPEDTNDMAYVFRVLEAQAQHVCNRLKEKGGYGFRTVVLTVRFSDFETKTRSATTDTYIQTAAELALKTTKLMLPFFDATENPDKKTFRLIGTRIEKIAFCDPNE